jgi:hypothetical protein
MSIQSDRWIREQAIKHKMIEPFSEKQVREGVISYGLSSYGYDLRVSDEFKIFTNVNSAIIDPTSGLSQAETDDLLANDPDGIVAFSSRGPVHDGRIKPDIVAPGTYVLSARSRSTNSEGWGVLASDTRYMFDGGTSMATPLVAGCVAVTRAFLKSAHGLSNPSAALLKALLINGARDLAGQYIPSEADSIPNNSEGFGRLDLQSVVGPYGPGESLQFWDEGAALDVNESSDQTIAVPAGTTGIKATLVWTDPPGEGLQSDLDLIVKIGSQERHGNLPGGSTEFDRMNNVEQVVWANIFQGTTTVSVVCHKVTLARQNFALVVRIAS